MASALGREAASQGADATTASGEWICARAEKMRGQDGHLLRHAAAVFRDIGGIVIRTKAAIEAVVKAAGYTALAGKESMAQAGNGRK